MAATSAVWKANRRWRTPSRKRPTCSHSVGRTYIALLTSKSYAPCGSAAVAGSLHPSWRTTSSDWKSIHLRSFDKKNLLPGGRRKNGSGGDLKDFIIWAFNESTDIVGRPLCVGSRDRKSF